MQRQDSGNYSVYCEILKVNAPPLPGEGRFIHTYMHDGNPLPSFTGEPKVVEIDGDIESFTQSVWESLNEDNKVSLFVRFIDIETGSCETRIVNKNV